MRDRLIELLRQIEFDYSEECVCAFEDGYKGALDFAKFFADYLLENGVIVPPVKIWQTVYVMESENTGYYECEIVSMQYDGVQWLGYMNPLWKHHHGGYWKWQEYEFGKTIFLTKEQAEKALEEAAHAQH